MKRLALLVALLICAGSANANPLGSIWRYIKHNKIEVISTLALVGATEFDIHETNATFRRCPGCIETGLSGNIVGSHPSPLRLRLTDYSLDAGLTIGEHFLHRWAAQDAGNYAALSYGTSWTWAAFHIHGGIHNIGVCPGNTFRTSGGTCQ